MKTKLLSLSATLLSFNLIVTGQSWNPKANLPSARTHGYGFSIGNKGYVGGGEALAGGGGTYQCVDLWEWDQSTNIWIQRANFPGGTRDEAVAFSIGTKGYVGTGYTSTTYSKDFYEWNQANNQWTRKSDFGGTARNSAVGFSIGTKGYIGTGADDPYGYETKDFWEYNPANDSWTRKADIPVARLGAVGFGIGAKGYIGTGGYYSFGLQMLADFWEYDQAGNSWVARAPFPGTARAGAVGFSIGAKGFIGTGSAKWNQNLADFWEWDQASNSWVQRPDYSGGPVRNAVGFSIGNKGYIGGGTNGAAGDKTSPSGHFSEYSDPSLPCILASSVSSSVAAICSGSGASANLTASGGTSYS